MIDEIFCLSLVSFDFKCKNRTASSGEILPVQLSLTGIFRHRRVMYRCHLGMAAEVSGHLLCILHMTFHAQGERLQPLQKQERMKRRQRSSHIPKKNRPDLRHKRCRTGRFDKTDPMVAGIRLRQRRKFSGGFPVEGSALHNHSSDRRTVTADEFCRRMYHDIRPMLQRADQDAATACNFLRAYDLIDVFKLNLEGNHANLAGHTYQHEIRVARDNGVLGSLDANQGDMLLGWDLDEFPTNLYETTSVMWEVLDEGQIGPHGGLNFDAKPRRTSFSAEDLFRAHIAGMDTFAAGLLVADKMHQDKYIEDLVANRYGSYDSGIGKSIDDGTATLESLNDYAIDMPQSEIIASTHPDHLEDVKATINNYIIDALANA